MFLFKKTILTSKKLQFCNYHKKSQIEMINLENPLMLIAQIYYLTLNAREPTRPTCFDVFQFVSRFHAVNAWRIYSAFF